MFLTTCSAYVHYWIIHFENYICTNFFHSLGLRTDWHGWLRSANNASGRTVPGNGRRQTSDIIHDTCYKASFCLRTKIEEYVVPRHCTTSCVCGRTHDLRLLLWLLLCCRALRWTLCARARAVLDMWTGCVSKLAPNPGWFAEVDMPRRCLHKCEKLLRTCVQWRNKQHRTKCVLHKVIAGKYSL